VRRDAVCSHVALARFMHGGVSRSGTLIETVQSPRMIAMTSRPTVKRAGGVQGTGRGGGMRVIRGQEAGDLVGVRKNGGASAYLRVVTSPPEMVGTNQKKRHANARIHL